METICPLEPDYFFFFLEKAACCRRNFSVFLFFYPPSIIPYLPPHESKQLTVAGKYNSFSPYSPYACRMQYICTQISIAHILWMIYKISCRKSVKVSTPENHLNRLLRRQDIIKSNLNFSSQGTWQIRLAPHPGKRIADLMVIVTMIKMMMMQPHQFNV